MSIATIFKPGTAVHENTYGKTGYIISQREEKEKMYMLSGGMIPITSQYKIVWLDKEHKKPAYIDDTPNTRIEAYVDRAKQYEIPSIDNVEELARQALENQEKGRQERIAAQHDSDKIKKEFDAKYLPMVPAWAKALLIGVLVKDDSDLMTDYHASTTTKTILLGFSKHTRDLFPEMRKAALNHPDTAFLHDACENAENREKYSMGGGYYLKNGYRHDNGWQISKVPFYGDKIRLPFGEWAVPENVKAPKASSTKQKAGIEEHHHTKHDIKMFIVIAPPLEKDEFYRLKAECKKAGGWYTRKWGKTPGGFAFTEKEKAEQFQVDHFGSSTPPDNNPADKLRKLADALTPKIEDCYRERTENSPRQQCHAARARTEGQRLKRTQQALNALADRHERGEVPAILMDIKTKKEVEELTKPIYDQGKHGYYEAWTDTGKPADTSEKALALWGLIQGISKEEQKKEALHRKIKGLQFSNIPGYFPTPGAVVNLMIDKADIQPMNHILEPSAGSGAIVDLIIERSEEYSPVKIDVIEQHHTLREILEGKGYALVGSDFLTFQNIGLYHRILLNPPFENLQDIEHIQKAYSLLLPGGRLVGIMSPSAFFRENKISTAFRKWFDEVAGEVEDLPADSFKESGTGVASKIVVIDK